jgi:hypothetical protein
MATVINTYAQLGQYIDSILATNKELPVNKAHKQFWDTLSYDDFVNGNCPNVVDPNSQPIKILVVGNSKASNLILALSGAAGTIFDPNGAIGQMPANGPPFFTVDQIAPIAAWIDAKCPK